MTNLRVPFSDRVYSIDGNPRDRSIVEALINSGGFWEPYLMSVMASCVSPEAVCCDVGANIGLLTLVMSSLASNGHVYAFEPAPQNAAFLRRNLASNSALNVTVFENGLWDRRGQFEIFHLDELAGCSFLEKNGNELSGLQKINSVVTQPWMREAALHTRRDPVQCLTMDEFVSESCLQRLDFIKIDAEGAEIPVVTGGVDTIRRYHPNLITEFNPACMKQYFAYDPRDYFDLLTRLYPNLFLIENQGSLTAVPSYDWLANRLAEGKGWEDMFCCW